MVLVLEEQQILHQKSSIFSGNIASINTNWTNVAEFPFLTRGEKDKLKSTQDREEQEDRA